MKKVLGFFSVSIALLFFIGCQKELNSTDIPQPINPVDDSTRLIKFFGVDSISPTQIDSAGYAHFFYDNNNRLTTIVENGTSDTSDINFGRTDYYYNALENLPFKEARSSKNNGIIGLVFQNYYRYNGSGKLVFDSSQLPYNSTIPWIDTIVLRYQYNGNAIYYSESHINNVYFFDTTTSGFVNGNRSSQFKKNYVQDLVLNYTFTYDNHPNPLHFNNLDVLKPIITDEDIFSLRQKQNCTQMNFSQTQGGVTYTKTYLANYVYKSNGYPSQVYITEINSGPSGTSKYYSKGTYIYGKK